MSQFLHLVAADKTTRAVITLNHSLMEDQKPWPPQPNPVFLRTEPSVNSSVAMAAGKSGKCELREDVSPKKL